MTDNTQAELDSIDEILNTYQIESILISKGITGQSDVTVKARQAIIDWHNKQVLEIIGEDEPPEGLTSWYDGIERDSRHREGRNMLREWQRNKLKESSNGH